jgi:parallel beta-helix repeat protein
MKKMERSRLSSRLILSWLTAVGAFFLCSVEAQAVPAKPITKCIEIKKPGFYKVNNDLTGSASGCLKISASNVTLDGNIKKITGVGTGIGLLITGSNVFFNRLTIKSFGIGVEVDGANAFGDTFFAQNNIDTGLLLNGSTGGKFNTFNADHNGNVGVHLKSSSGNVMLYGTTFDDANFGFWFDSSSNNTLHFLSVSAGLGANPTGCAIEGIYLGCSSAGFGGQCVSNGASNGNRFTNSSVSGCATDMAIDVGSLGNVITQLSAKGTKDGNANCGTNLWFNNTITTPDQSCEN